MRATEIKEIKNEITIGGSVVGAICGLSKYETEYSVWRKLIGLDPPKFDNDAMMFGRHFEYPVLSYFCEKNNIDVSKIHLQKFLKLGVASAKIDGVLDEGGNVVIYEIKTTRGYDIRDEWIMQLQWYIGIYKKIYNVNSIKGKLLILNSYLSVEDLDVNYDEDLFNLMDEKCGDFYYRHIINMEEPPKKYFEFNEDNIDKNSVVDLSEYFDDIEVLQNLKESKKSIEEKIDAIEEKIKTAMGDKENGVCGNRTITYKLCSRESVDIQKLKKELPNYRDFIKNTTFRKLTIK